jgi:hypothetical protein
VPHRPPTISFNLPAFDEGDEVADSDREIEPDLAELNARKRLVSRLTKLGFQVQPEPLTPAA